jgi:peroxiredoxin Q/BCP
MAQKAPDFDLLDQDGNKKSLKDYAGNWLVLYFYPRDDTPGCTAEACNFRDERDVIAELGNAQIVGISKDSVASHKKFVDKNHLNFTILSDSDHKTMEAYGAWGPRKFMGREFLGAHRNTYIINPEGKMVKKYFGVDPRLHARDIISDLKRLQAAA